MTINVVSPSKTMTPNEKRFLGIAPWLVSGRCECGNLVTVTAYGLLKELQTIQLVCEECRNK